MLANLKILILTLKDIFKLIVGFLTYRLKLNTPYSKRTFPKTNVALVNTFCRKENKSNYLLDNIISAFDKLISVPQSFTTPQEN